MHFWSRASEYQHTLQHSLTILYAALRRTEDVRSVHKEEGEADLLEETASPDTGPFFWTGLFLDGSSPSCRAPLPIGRLSGVAIPQKILRFDQELQLATF